LHIYPFVAIKQLTSSPAPKSAKNSQFIIAFFVPLKATHKTMMKLTSGR